MAGTDRSGVHDGPVLGFTTVRIVGPSMEPELRNGETYLARTRFRLRAGDVVVLRHPERRELLTVKRLVRQEAGGWWVEGDNPESSSDSRQFGVVTLDLIVARILTRLRPLRR